MKKALFIFLFFSQLLYSQKNEKTIDVLIDNFTRTQYSNKDSSFYYIKKAVDLAQKEKDNFQLSTCFFYLGRYYYNQSDPIKAKYFIFKSLEIAQKTKNNKALALNYNQLGLIEKDNGDFNKSLSFLLKSLDIADKNNLLKNKCNALNNLGTLYELQKDTLKALKCYTNNIKIAKENNFNEVLLYSYSSLGIINRKTNKNDAIKYYNLAYTIASQLNDEYEKASLLVNSSEVLLSTDSESNYLKAYNCLIKLKEIAAQTKNNDLLFYYYFNLAAYYSKTKKYDNSIKMYFEALNLSKNEIDSEQKISLLRSISKVYKKSGNYQQALSFSEKYHSLQDSIFSIKKNKAFNEIQTKYEVEKKNLKIGLLSKEKIIERTKKKLIMYVGIAILIPLLILVFFYRNRIKLQKVIREKESELFLKEKIELEQQKELERITGMVQGQDQERNRLAKEIHDGVGGDLAGIKLQLHQINSTINSDSIKVVIKQIAKVFNDLRGISHDLSLNTILERNLESLLIELKQDYESRNEFAVELLIFPNNALDEFSENLKHQLYRILQELLANVSKHANAKNVSISFTKNQNQLNLIFEDDGLGFENKNKKGIGIKNIEERLIAINGKMTIESNQKNGTSIFIDISI